MTASVEDGFTCSREVEVKVSANGSNSIDSAELAKIVGLSRAALGFECPQVEQIDFYVHETGGTTTRYIATKRKGWVLSGIPDSNEPEEISTLVASDEAGLSRQQSDDYAERLVAHRQNQTANAQESGSKQHSLDIAAAETSDILDWFELYAGIKLSSEPEQIPSDLIKSSELQLEKAYRIESIADWVELGIGGKTASPGDFITELNGIVIKDKALIRVALTNNLKGKNYSIRYSYLSSPVRSVALGTRGPEFSGSLRKNGTIREDSYTFPQSQFDKVFTVIPYSPERVSYIQRNSNFDSLSDFGPLMKERGECQDENGNYPNIPNLNYDYSGQSGQFESPDQLALIEAENTLDNAGNAVRSIANARLAMEKMAGDINSARSAFWQEFNKGVYDEQLRRRYAYILAEGKKYDTQGTKGPLGIFFDISSASTSGQFDYPAGPALSIYEFLKNSRCSPLRSENKIERSAGGHWEKNVSESRLAYWDWDDVFSATGELMSLSEERFYRGMTPPMLGSYDSEKPWVRSDPNGIQGGGEAAWRCARWALTHGDSWEKCVEDINNANEIPMSRDPTSLRAYKLIVTGARTFTLGPYTNVEEQLSEARLLWQIDLARVYSNGLSLAYMEDLGANHIVEGLSVRLPSGVANLPAMTVSELRACANNQLDELQKSLYAKHGDEYLNFIFQHRNTINSLKPHEARLRQRVQNFKGNNLLRYISGMENAIFQGNNLTYARRRFQIAQIALAACSPDYNLDSEELKILQNRLPILPRS